MAKHYKNNKPPRTGGKRYRSEPQTGNGLKAALTNAGETVKGVCKSGAGFARRTGSKLRGKAEKTVYRIKCRGGRYQPFVWKNGTDPEPTAPAETEQEKPAAHYFNDEDEEPAAHYYNDADEKPAAHYFNDEDEEPDIHYNNDVEADEQGDGSFTENETKSHKNERADIKGRVLLLFRNIKERAAGLLQSVKDRFFSKNRESGGSEKVSQPISADALPTPEQLEAELDRVKYQREHGRLARNIIFALITVAAVTVLISSLFMPVLQIYGASMNPTLSEGNIVVSVRTADFERGDVISYYYNNKILVKRVIAFGGEYVNIGLNGDVYVNNRLIDEPYLSESAKAFGECDVELPYQVPPGKLFVLGDNRSASVDSRSSIMGCVAEEQIAGKILFRVWPLDRLGGIG